MLTMFNVATIHAQDVKCNGNGQCDENENCLTCAKDCGECCGNGKCELEFEDCTNCPSDCDSCGWYCPAKECEGSNCVQQSVPTDIYEISPPSTSHDRSMCGNDICDLEIENIDNCPIDCETCETRCGDGICSNSEDCSCCPKDCGHCQCRIVESIGVGAKFTKKINPVNLGTPEILGSRLYFKASGKFNLVENTGNYQKCFFKANALGSLETCFKLLGDEHCVGTSLFGFGKCKAPLNCDNDSGSCNFGSSCCNGFVNASLNYGRNMELAKFPLGPMQLKLGAGFRIFGGINLGEIQLGLSEKCPFSVGVLKPSLRGEAAAEGKGTLLLCGKNIEIQVEAEICSKIKFEKAMSTGMGLTFTFKPVQIGYFMIGGWKAPFESGSGC